jgi:hypothetical protein
VSHGIAVFPGDGEKAVELLDTAVDNILKP